MDHENVFQLNETLESINHGVDRFDLTQIYPISGNISNSVVGSGQASGLTVFQFSDSNLWWSPANSYFSMSLTFNNLPADNVAYADNFICTLFTSIQSQLNSRTLDIINSPHIIDSALTYSNCNKNFLATFGSMTRVGEPLMTRIINTSSTGANSGVVEVIFKPPISLMDVKLMPPGCEIKLIYNWVSSAINAFECPTRSLTIGTGNSTSGVAGITVNGFSFYKATYHPSQLSHLPQKGVIDLFPSISNQYFLTTTSTLRQNLTLCGTTNKITVVFQDMINISIDGSAGTVDNTLTGVGNGFNPATSFSNQFSILPSAVINPTNTATYSVLQQLYLNLPELGVQIPNGPVYNFDYANTDMLRAYSDFCHYTQCVSSQREGNVQYGNNKVDKGTTLSYIDTAALGSCIVNRGNPYNPQQYEYISSVAPPSTLTTSSYSQTARYGWLGRCPGPIFIFPVVRPAGKMVSTGTLNITTTTNVAQVACTVICSYSMALVVELQPNGLYQYTIIEGV